MGKRPPRRRRGARVGRRRDRPRRTTGIGSRGQSTSLDYTLGLAIATLLVTGLVTAASGFVADNRQQVVRTELEVVGEHVANELVAADRLAQSGAETERLSVSKPLPARVAGTGYAVETNTVGSTQWVNLTASSPDITVSIRVRTATPIADAAVDGGTITITYDPSADRLEVSS